MLFSMTGFGQAMLENDQVRIAFRLRSVNNKGLDIQLKLLPEMTYLEGKFRQIVKKKFFRGRIDVSLEFEVKNPDLLPPASFDHSRLVQIMSMAEEMKKYEGISGSLDINTLIRLPELFIEQKMGYTYPEPIEKVIVSTFEAACAALSDSRAVEGSHLLEELRGRLTGLKAEKDKVQAFIENRTDELRDQVVKRIEALNLEIQIDANRLAQEVVFYVDRYDITEELTRLEAHLSTMENRLDSPEQPKGRALEFLLQEMFREITTIGNKVKLLDAANQVVIMKTECEKMKEQILNVE